MQYGIAQANDCYVVYKHGDSNRVGVDHSLLDFLYFTLRGISRQYVIDYTEDSIEYLLLRCLPK